jgi:hypothetical protein
VIKRRRAIGPTSTSSQPLQPVAAWKHPCRTCGGKVTVVSFRPYKSIRGMHLDKHFEGECQTCGQPHWRHGNDSEPDPTWFLPSERSYENCRC